MRIRRKKWAEKELNESKYYIDKPEVNKGSWRSNFKNSENKLFIELGCGKGIFIATLAKNHPEINYIAVDMIEAMLGLSRRNIEEAFEGKNPENLWLIRANVEQISNVFSQEDKVDRIHINFCNPWPKSKHNKRRLTHTRQLEKYKTFLNKQGEIYFKTDDDELFKASLCYFKEAGFEIIKSTYDLHEENVKDNIITEHEEMFSSQGIKIKALIAKRK